MRNWLCRSLAVVSLFFLASSGAAQVAGPCPPKLEARPARCALYVREAEREQAERTEAVAYRVQHRWSLGVVLQGDGTLLGLGDVNVAATSSLSMGIALRHWINPRLRWRLDLLGRVGEGSIDSWNLENLGDIHDHTGPFGGAELHGELLVHPGRAYVGPALSVGVLRMRGRTLREEDYAREPEDHYINGLDRAHVPDLGAYVAGGMTFGVESPQAGMAVGLRLLMGVWNDLKHPYLQVALNVTIGVWD